jgi:hypothetical protein
VLDMMEKVCARNPMISFWVLHSPKRAVTRTLHAESFTLQLSGTAQLRGHATHSASR